RHTRSYGDWSSDVCSSDLDLLAEDGTAQRDYVVELGSERLVEEIENGIRGLSPGEEREIAYELADGSRRKATVVLKELKQRVLPDRKSVVEGKRGGYRVGR